MNHFDSKQVGNVLNQLDRFDAGESAIITRQLAYVRSQVFETVYGGLIARQLVPVDNSPPNGAESVKFHMSDRVGKAAVNHPDAKNPPSVDVSMKETSQIVHSITVAFHYSIQDLRASAMAGHGALSDLRARAARRAVEEEIERIAILGDAKNSLPGLAGNLNIDETAPDTGDWATASRAEIKTDIEKVVNDIVEEMDGIPFGPLTVALPLAAFNRLNNAELGSGSDKTLLRSLLENNQYIREFVPVPRLALAGGTGNETRMVVYPRNPEVLQLVIPQEFEMLPPQAVGMLFNVPCHARIAGVEVRYPKACRYSDGI